MRRDVMRIAVSLAGGIVLAGVLGILYAAGWAVEAFSLDGEYTVPAFYSTGLLLGAAGFAVAASRGRPPADRRALLVVAAVLAFLGLDELVSVHERLDTRISMDWQVLYLPLAVCFGWAAWQVARCLGREGSGARLLFAGVAAWMAAQLLEALAFADLTPGLVNAEGKTSQQINDATHSLAFYAMSIPEELLEMTGSLLFAVAFASAVRRRAGAPD
jgi:hypothetical protein